jgi:hypothetical protein
MISREFIQIDYPILYLDNNQLLIEYFADNLPLLYCLETNREFIAKEWKEIE